MLAYHFRQRVPPTATAAQASGPSGGGGLLRILQYQAPTVLNPHLSSGYKDYDAARIVYESLADFDADGNAIVALATEFPTFENGGVSQDGTTVTWKLQPGASGTTASRSRPTMSSSPGSTRPIPTRRR